MFNLSGIFRDVYVYSLPKQVHILDFKWLTTIDHSMHIATVDIDVKLNWDRAMLSFLTRDNPENESTYLVQLRNAWILRATLYEEGVMVSSLRTQTSHSFAFDNSSPQPQCSKSCFVSTPSMTPGSKDTVFSRLTLSVHNPTLWSAEKPHVYTLVVSLHNVRDGITVQAESCRLGFRTIDIHNGQLRVNHRPILVRGANVHEHDPVTGHYVAPSLIEADVKLLKRNNFNAVRTSHYPQTPWFYELCTVYGLFVVDEANIETHGMKPYIGRLSDDLQWKDAYMLRLTRMYERDKVHPCIIGWSLGNESGYGANHEAMAAWIRSKDKTRVLFYEPASFGPRAPDATVGTAAAWVTHDKKGRKMSGKIGGSGGQDLSRVGTLVGGPGSAAMATDVLCPMYARVGDCITLANIYPDFPLILCEYAHMMGRLYVRVALSVHFFQKLVLEQTLICIPSFPRA